jgi:hypothetical protein
LTGLAVVDAASVLVEHLIQETAGPAASEDQPTVAEQLIDPEAGQITGPGYTIDTTPYW